MADKYTYEVEPSFGWETKSAELTRISREAVKVRLHVDIGFSKQLAPISPAKIKVTGEKWAVEYFEQFMRADGLDARTGTNVKPVEDSNNG